MGNCQAIDNATILIQHPSGRADKLYWPVTAKEVMKSNPGHFVALLLTTTTTTTTTTFCPPATATDKSAVNHNSKDTVRVTRIKLLRPTDTLILGQVYRLITNQEVTKGLSAKKCAKIKKNQNESTDPKERMKQKPNLDFELQPNNSEMDKNKQVQKHGKNQSTRTAKSATKLRPWQPSLNSISESIS